MRGEVCVGAASVLSAASLIMLIFLQVGQINTSSVPKGIYMARVNTSGYGDALASATQDPIQDLYTTNASLELGHHLGLRDDYRFGLYTHCAYVSPARAANATNSTSSSGGGTCANHTTGAPYRPYSAITVDMVSNYTNLTNLILPASATRFRDEDALGAYTTGAYYLILLGTIATALAFLIGTLTRTYTFLLSTSFAVLGTTLLLIAAAMWTAMVNRSEDVNSFVIDNGVARIPLGVHVQAGPGLYLLWAAFAALFASVVPYMISCCTYRG